ncbi:MAG TPA: PAS domain-containing protein, partial [Kofleriaceae bacterium]|nr:PAS domain-containing protein [Kofleriaceae bacterium]
MAGPSPVELTFPDAGGEMARLMRDTRWDATVLGPIERWPSALRATVRMLLTSRFSMWMGWGDDLTVFYNDAYRANTLGSKHPWALGRPAREVWREIWPEIGPRIARVLAEGRATWDEGLMLMLERSGYSEETYHTFSYSPLHEDDGRVRGFLCVVTEDTGRLISERRVGLLGRLASETAGAKTSEAALAGIERSLATDARDLPFTLTYLFDASAGIARLASQTGFGAGALGGAPIGAPIGATTIPLDGGSRWRLDELVKTERPIEVALDDVWPAGPWATPPARA